MLAKALGADTETGPMAEARNAFDAASGDVVLADVRGASIDRLLDLAPSTVDSLPAVEAGQMLAWPACYAMAYGHVASILDDLAAAVEQASDDVV